MMTTQELDVTALLDSYYGHTMNAFFYANLLARHGESVLANLTLEPGRKTLALAFRTNNEQIPLLAKSQFALEVGRYSLIFALAHFDRFVLDLAVLHAVVGGIEKTGGHMTVGQAKDIETEVRTVRRNQSVSEELRRLGGSRNETVAAGIGWFRGLYAIRNCIVHRAAIVGLQDKRLLEGITWRRVAVTLNGEELQGELPLAVQAGGTVGLTFTDSFRSWSAGDRVILSVEEIQEMMYSLFQLAAVLVQHLNGEFAARLAPLSE